MTGYPWAQGDQLLANDLNAAFAALGGTGFLPLTGGTLIGPLVLWADPSAPLQAATKNYVDGLYAVGLPPGGPFLPLAGGTVTGATIHSGPNPQLMIDGAAGTFRALRWTSAGTARWGLLTESTAEGGSNVGSNLVLNLYNDAGAVVQPPPIQFTRSNGLVTIGTSLQLANNTTYPPGAQPVSAIRLFSNNTVFGTGVTGSAHVHRFWANSDQVQFTDGGTNGLALIDARHNFGGGTTQGWRTTAQISQSMNGTTSNKAAGVNPINVTLMVNNSVNVNDGGTGLHNSNHANATALPWNATTGIGIQSTIYSGATYQAGQTGMEIDVGGYAGASARSKKGLLLVKWSFDAYQSPQDDCAIHIADQSSASVGWTTGIRFGSSVAQWPIDQTNGTLIGAVFSPGVHSNARYGIDFSDVAFPAFGNTRSAGFLSSNNFGVDGAGAVMIGSVYLTPSATGLAIDAKGLVSTGATVAAGGSGYAVFDILYDAYGGMYRVASLSGTAVATVTAYVDDSGNTHAANYFASAAPTNPIATTVWDAAAGIASGCTLNLTWNTTANGLSLNPTGQHIGFNGTTPIAKPTVSGAKGSNAALASLMTALAAYGLVVDTTTA